jgi:hypothetical protein
MDDRTTPSQGLPRQSRIGYRAGLPLPKDIRVMSRLIAVLALALAMAACQRADDADAPATAPATEAAQTASTPATEPSATAAAATDAGAPVGQCGDQSALSPEERVANTPKWSTASELENFGFDVYRGDSEEGPFERLTQTPIQGAGTSDEPHSYSYRDDTIDPCREYWYYVESISTSGTREKFTPTFRAPAKRRAAD